MPWQGPLLAALLLAGCVHAAGSVTPQELLEEARGFFPWLQHHRRSLHKVPELAFQEDRTSAYIRAQLKDLGIPFKQYSKPAGAKTGVVGTLGSGEPRFLLRSDIDALPITEANDVEYASTFPGRMHACGHDTHMTMLLGAGKLLKAREAELKGTVLLMFQPAEESRGGARDMIEAGVLEGVSGAAALHVWPELPSGVISTKAGTIMAASDRFNITVLGRGGHAGLPHKARDPVVAAAALVGALQTLVSRETAPTDGAVVGVSRFNTGPGASNVIPNSVEMLGTIRALTHARFIDLRQRVTEVAKGLAAAHGCSVEVQWSDRQYIPTVNHAGMAQLVRHVAGELSTFEPLQEPSMAAEDFSFLADEVPAVFTFLGIRNETAGSVHGLHTPVFTMDEAQLPVGAALHAATALRFLSDGGSGGGSSGVSVRSDEL
jgi:IAA-amino acid hydrolase